MSEKNPAPLPEQQEKAVLVVLEDGTTTRIGPIPYDHLAEQMVRGFEGMRHNTAGAATARFDIVPYDPAAEHLPLVSASMDAILATWDVEGERADGPFPDLWARLCAQHGQASAMRPWKEACAYVDYMAEAAEQEAAEQAACAARRREITEAVRAFGEHCAGRFEACGQAPGHDDEELQETVEKILKIVGED